MESFKIKVMVLTREMELDVTGSTKISDLKRMIQSKGANIAFIKKKFVHLGNTLNENMTLNELGITTGSTIEIQNI